MPQGPLCCWGARCSSHGHESGLFALGTSHISVIVSPGFDAGGPTTIGDNVRTPIYAGLNVWETDNRK